MVICLILAVYETISWTRAILAEYRDDSRNSVSKVRSLLLKADDHRDDLKIFCQAFVWGAVASALIVYAAYYFGIQKPFTNAERTFQKGADS